MKKMEQYQPNRHKSKKAFNGRKNIDDMYDENWAKHSRKFLSMNPKCYACGDESEVTDHLRPHKGDKTLFWKPDNMIPLCKTCHNKVTNNFDRRFVVGSSIDPKLIWLRDQRLKRGLEFRVIVVPVPENMVELSNIF